MHVFTRIVIFRLSGKAPDQNVIVKHNIDQNKFLRGGGKFLFSPGPHPDSWRAWLFFCMCVLTRVQRIACHRALPFWEKIAQRYL